MYFITTKRMLEVCFFQHTPTFIIEPKQKNVLPAGNEFRIRAEHGQFLCNIFFSCHSAFFFGFIWLRTAPMRVNAISARKNQQIGVLKNTPTLPLDFKSAVRKFFSAIGPKIRPRIAGLVGIFTLPMSQPMTPAISIVPTS